MPCRATAPWSCPTATVSSSSPRGQRALELLDDLIDGEAGGRLARWELLEGRQELGDHPGGGEDDVVVVEQPVVVGVRGDVGALERVGGQVVELRHPQR